MKQRLKTRMDKPIYDTVSTLRTPGKVYFVQAEGGGLVKIGWATSPSARIGNMQMYCPVRLDLLLEVVGDGPLERSLHLRFAASRRHGEWFEPTAELLELIEVWRKDPPPAPDWKRPAHSTYEPKTRRRPINVNLRRPEFVGVKDG